ncbi:hypothetical protein P3F83_18560 [Mycobacteroides immunogenum]|uniref:hypothetical protein n=1 Tax=Mycobacteroides immunogenum TaxID=83262 RepID=UPI0025B78213|nr:hypothetical protein [Mycobacteroides immunogenum]WJR32510.1 hypothetical protein P3F83_18560 [Mycobacteroides immunogenum]
MTVSIMNSAACQTLALDELGLGQTGADLFSVEGLAASLRRAASFLCPCPPRQIVDGVLQVLRPLRPDIGDLRGQIGDVLDLLIAGGDLVELRQDQETRATRLIYLGPPTYVEKAPGQYLVAGVRPYGKSLVDLDSAGVMFEAHTRTLCLDPATAPAELSTRGLARVSADVWVGRPRTESALGLLERVGVQVDNALQAGGLSQLHIIDPAKPVTYYKGRWRDLVPSDDGIFVGRREQAYGADLWCAVGVADGVPQQLVDFPIDDPVAPGRDEAWRFQAAIDAESDRPQRYRVRPIDGGTNVIFDFFSPLPGWAERRLQLVGIPLNHQVGALFSVRIQTAASSALRKFLDEMLWMADISEEGKP